MPSTELNIMSQFSITGDGEVVTCLLKTPTESRGAGGRAGRGAGDPRSSALFSNHLPQSSMLVMHIEAEFIIRGDKQ